MKPVDQSVLHEPEQGRFGDCMRAVFASLLELPIHRVPHFLFDGCGAHTFNRRINEWLRPANLAYFPITRISVDLLDDLGIVGLHHEASGNSPRGTYHACCARDGTVTHDPHPTKAGLNESDLSGVLLLLDPSKPVALEQLQPAAEPLTQENP